MTPIDHIRQKAEEHLRRHPRFNIQSFLTWCERQPAHWLHMVEDWPIAKINQVRTYQKFQWRKGPPLNYTVPPQEQIPDA